jgi:hypothetical protein
LQRLSHEVQLLAIMFQLYRKVIIKHIIGRAIDSIDESNDLLKETSGLLNGLLLKRIEICLSNDAVIQGLRNTNKSPLEGLQVQAVPLGELSLLKKLSDASTKCCRAYREYVE